MPTISKVFIDTNAFVALRDENDSTHKKARKLIEKLLVTRANLFTSSDVVGETLTVVSKKLGKKHTIEFAHGVDEMAEEIFISEDMHREARNLFLKAKSKNVSFIDCSSVVAMKKENIKFAFTFDKHFRSLGVKLLSDVL